MYVCVWRDQAIELNAGKKIVCNGKYTSEWSKRLFSSQFMDKGAGGRAHVRTLTMGIELGLVAGVSPCSPLQGCMQQACFLLSQGMHSTEKRLSRKGKNHTHVNK